MEHILKWFTNFGGSDALKYVIWFDAVFNPSDFRGMDSLFACFLKYCAKLGIVPCRRYLDTYIKIDCKGDIRKYNIKPDDNDVYDYKQISQLDSAYEVIKTTVGTLFDMYMQEDLTDREFKLDMYEYMNDMKAVKITEAINSVAPDISNRLDVSAASEKLRANLVRIEEVYNIDTTGPEGKITIATNEFYTFLNNITFGTFFNKTQTVTIKAYDELPPTFLISSLLINLPLFVYQ